MKYIFTRAVARLLSSYVAQDGMFFADALCSATEQEAEAFFAITMMLNL